MDGAIVVLEFRGDFFHLFGCGLSVVREVHKKLVAEGTLPAKNRVPQRKRGGKPAE